MCEQTVILPGGAQLTGRLVEHVGKGCVVIDVDGKHYFGVKIEHAMRRALRESVSNDAG